MSARIGTPAGSPLDQAFLLGFLKAGGNLGLCSGGSSRGDGLYITLAVILIAPCFLGIGSVPASTFLEARGKVVYPS